LGRDLSQQPPPPPEAKKSNRLIAVAIVMLLIGVVIGVAVGWSIGQSRSQAVQSEYTRVKVLTDDFAMVAFGEEPNKETYFFYYKSMGHYDGKGIWIGEYNPQTPITVDVSGFSDRNLPSTVG
jgi:hypothetical protein